MLTKRPWHHDHFLGCRALGLFLEGFVGQSRFFNVFFAGRGGHRDGPAQLAVDLQHEFDLVAQQRGFVHGEPSRVKQIARAGGEAEHSAHKWALMWGQAG